MSYDETAAHDHKAYVTGVRFEGITAVYALTVRLGASPTGAAVAETTFRRYGLGVTNFDDLVNEALDTVGFIRTGPFVPHQGNWECWCTLSGA
jgi:hypothetical protein